MSRSECSCGCSCCQEISPEAYELFKIVDKERREKLELREENAELTQEKWAILRMYMQLRIQVQPEIEVARKKYGLVWSI